MKTFKKISFGLVLLASLIVLGLLANPRKSIAAQPPQDNSLPDFYAACVVNVAQGLSDNMCTLNDKTNGYSHLLYDGLDDIETNQAHYLASSGTTTETSGSVTVNFPKTLTLLNTSNQSLFSGNLANDAAKYGVLSFSGSVYNTYSQNSKYSTIDKSHAQIYGVYTSGTPNIVFLASINSDGSTQVLAEAYNVPQSSGLTSAGTIYAATINLQALTSNSSGGVNPPTTTAASSGNSCEQDSAFGFEWLVCGVLRGLGDFIDKVNGFIEDQLNFDVNKNLNANVHQAWSAFRVISSALLVIIMLVMVFSQAISAGPFDAYTVRKLLPRLVAAVIIIQVSWFLSIYIINFANDLGKGIADLVAAPFGGTTKLNLADLIGNINSAAPGVTVIGGFLATGIAAAINPFGALMLAFFIFLGVLVATAVLLIRVALIIGCVIFMPIGLVAWILPGTERYWKLLWDNFIKALLLFPLIIGVIYVGRVFAWIVGSSNSSTILSIFAVVIGFFGPYFLFPRMFKWGGNIMSTATGSIESGINKMGEKPREFLKGRQQELKQYRQQKSAQRVYEGKPSLLRFDQFRSGKLDPTLLVGGGGRERRQAQIAKYIKAGREVGKQQTEDYTTVLNAETEKMTKDQAIDFLMDRFKDSKAHGAEKFAAFQKLTQFKAADQIEAIRDNLSSSKQGQTFWNQLSNSYYDQIKSIAPHLAAQFDGGGRFPDAGGMFRGASDEFLSGMTAHSWGRFAHSNPQAAQTAFERIRNNPSLSGRMDPGAFRFFGPNAAPPIAPSPNAPSSSGGAGEYAQHATEVYSRDNAGTQERTVDVTRDNIRNMDESNAMGWVTSQGGFESMSNQDLVAFYNNQRGAPQQGARDELQRRGLFNPQGPNLP